MATPAITTIRQPLKEMGLQAAEWAMQAIAKRGNSVDEAPRLYKALPELVVRESTCGSARSGDEKTASDRH